MYSFDITEETYRKAPWLVSPNEIKKHLEAVLFGEKYYLPDASKNPDGTAKYYDYTNSELSKKYKSGTARFVELIGHYDTLEEADTIRGNKTTSKTVIIYVYIGN